MPGRDGRGETPLRSAGRKKEEGCRAASSLCSQPSFQPWPQPARQLPSAAIASGGGMAAAMSCRIVAGVNKADGGSLLGE